MSNVPSVGDPEAVALLEKIFACFNSHDPAKFRAFCSDEFEFHDSSRANTDKGTRHVHSRPGEVVGQHFRTPGSLGK